MKATMYDYWKKQPEVMESILDNPGGTKEFTQLFCNIKPTHIYLVGSGTSLNVHTAASDFLERILDVDVKVMPSSRICNIRGERPMVVFLSQGGSSTNTLEAMRMLENYPAVTITGEAKCEIESRSRHHMLIGCGTEDVGPKTIGYTASIMCLYVSAVEAAYLSGKISPQKKNDLYHLFRKSAEQMRENIKSCEAWFDRNKEKMKKIKKYVLIGAGKSALALQEGSLKLLETVKLPSLNYEFEEYLHGPILFTDNVLGGFFFISENGREKERMIKLAECHKEYSPYTYVITSDIQIKGEHVLHIVKTGHSETEVFECILIPQLIAAKLPEVMGISEGAGIYDVYTSKCPTKFNNGR